MVYLEISIVGKDIKRYNIQISEDSSKVNKWLR